MLSLSLSHAYAHTSIFSSLFHLSLSTYFILATSMFITLVAFLLKKNQQTSFRCLSLHDKHLCSSPDTSSTMDCVISRVWRAESGIRHYKGPDRSSAQHRWYLPVHPPSLSLSLLLPLLKKEWGEGGCRQALMAKVSYQALMSPQD